jgi:hypothetical protein
MQKFRGLISSPFTLNYTIKILYPIRSYRLSFHVSSRSRILKNPVKMLLLLMRKLTKFILLLGVSVSFLILEYFSRSPNMSGTGQLMDLILHYFRDSEP